MVRGGRWARLAPRAAVASDLASYQWYLLGVAGIVAFGLACWGYAQAHESFSDILYKSFTLFFLSGPDVHPLPLQLDIARFLAPFVAGFAGLSALRLLFWDRLQQMRIPFMRNHVVVCGLGYVGSTFIRHLRAEGKKVVVIDSDAANKHFESCRRLRVPVIIGDAQSERTLRVAGAERASRLLAVCDYDAINAEIVAIAEQISARRARGQLHCLARINDQDLCRQFRIHASQRQSKASTVDFLNIDDVAARQLLDDFPITDCDQPHIFVAHLDPLGQWLVVQAALDWQVSGRDAGTPLHVSVLDDEAEKRIKSLMAEHHYATRACAFHHDSFTAGGIRELLLKHETDPDVPPVSHAFVTAFRDEHGLETALKLQHQMLDRNVDVPVVAALSRAHGVSSLVRDAESHQKSALKIRVFQTLRHVCTIDVLEAGVMETMLARQIHEYWREMATAEGREAPAWEDTAGSDREASRAQARDIPVKLRKIGCKMAPVGSADAEHRLTEADIEVLARDEHNRWWKDRIMAGWTRAEDRDNPKKLHPDMKPFDQLTVEVADKDRTFIRALPELLASMNYRIVSRSS